MASETEQFTERCPVRSVVTSPMRFSFDAAIVEAPPAARFEFERRQRHARAGRGRRKYIADDRIDTIIREVYRRRLEENDRQATRWAQLETGWPKFMIARRGAELGLARTKEPNWSPPELAILEETAHLGVEAVRKRLAKLGFARSRTAILLKRKRLKLTAHLDGYSGNALAELFGVDNHRIYRWITDGILVAERCGTDRSHRQGGDTYWIRRQEVHTFAMNHPDEYDLRKVEKWWFLSLITEGRISR
jgi:hypothetical protein